MSFAEKYSRAGQRPTTRKPAQSQWPLVAHPIYIRPLTDHPLARERPAQSKTRSVWSEAETPSRVTRLNRDVSSNNPAIKDY